jgi:hypothetical protein
MDGSRSAVLLKLSSASAVGRRAKQLQKIKSRREIPHENPAAARELKKALQVG